MCFRSLLKGLLALWFLLNIAKLSFSPMAAFAESAPLDSFPYHTCTAFPPGQYSSSLYIDPLGNPHVAWEQVLDNGITPDGLPCWQNDIYYTKSVDEGATFLPATAEIDRILATQARACLAIDGDGNPGVVWVDNREVQKYVYFSRSFDGGETFLPGIRVDASPRRQDRPFLLFDSDGNPLVAWIKFHYEGPHMNPVGYIYVSKSTDGGLTFLPSVCVCCGARPYQGWHSMAIDSHDNPLIVAHYYNIFRHCWDVYFVKSLDQGASFATPVLVESTPHDQAVAGKHVMVVDSSDNPIIALMDRRTGFWNVRVAKSLDGGLTFLPSVAVDSHPAAQVIPSLGIDSADNIYVAWSDRRSGYENIFFSMSEDAGLTFGPSMAVDPQPVLQNRPSLDVDFYVGIPHITWTDVRQGICYVYHSKSMDNGVTFLPAIPVYEHPLP